MLLLVFEVVFNNYGLGRAIKKLWFSINRPGGFSSAPSGPAHKTCGLDTAALFTHTTKYSSLQVEVKQLTIVTITVMVVL